jgi:hypothetical protein
VGDTVGPPVGKLAASKAKPWGFWSAVRWELLHHNRVPPRLVFVPDTRQVWSYAGRTSRSLCGKPGRVLSWSCWDDGGYEGGNGGSPAGAWSGSCWERGRRRGRRRTKVLDVDLIESHLSLGVGTPRATDPCHATAGAVRDPSPADGAVLVRCTVSDGEPDQIKGPA